MKPRSPAPALLAAAVALAACVGPVLNPHAPQPLKAVVASRYVGRWYEIARYPLVFENGCEAATAQYARLPDGSFSVLNQCRKGGPRGPVQAIRGTAALVPDSGGAKLRVAFFHGLVRADYWVLDHDAGYSWAIVGEPSGRFLWLLARTPLTGEARDALVRHAADLGYPTAPLHLTEQAAE